MGVKERVEADDSDTAPLTLRGKTSQNIKKSASLPKGKGGTATNSTVCSIATINDTWRAYIYSYTNYADADASTSACAVFTRKPVFARTPLIFAAHDVFEGSEVSPS